MALREPVDGSIVDSVGDARNTVVDLKPEIEKLLKSTRRRFDWNRQSGSTVKIVLTILL
jgi:hypothetical protein